MRRSVRWPKAPNALGNALRRMASNLRAAGIEIQFSRVERLRLARQFARIVAIQDSPSAEAHPRMSDTLVHPDRRTSVTPMYAVWRATPDADKGNKHFRRMTVCGDLCSFAPDCGAISQNLAKESLPQGVVRTPYVR